MQPPSVQSRSRRVGIDAAMTPMIDVIFLLLIFFLVTAGFSLPESVLPAGLPATDTAAARPLPQPSDLEIVHIRLTGRDADFRIELNRRPLEGLAELTAELAKLAPAAGDLPVILDIAGEVALGNVVAVYDQCLGGGFRKIHFAAGNGAESASNAAPAKQEAAPP
jgi:biopolymer transport protein ExbD